MYILLHPVVETPLLLLLFLLVLVQFTNVFVFLHGTWPLPPHMSLSMISNPALIPMPSLPYTLIAASSSRPTLALVHLTIRPLIHHPWLRLDV
ncbi:hypothetical protein K504DRAFT_464292 [Pleomassaria siparia CBS 279.74]|uniref:Uncharacterized protein n=1 Tax=Pleomassaria siparia CBS 279.74 TaxID=1314801 RepID=A0A6G1KII1_9PLEO|nr:hypothetical protein K504DRAFT_464292 [Pleomassaria siparia CBS 279.74]